MAIVLSHSNREIIKLVLTAPRDCHTRLVGGGNLATDHLRLAKLCTAPAGKSVIGVNLQKREQFIKGQFLQLARILQCAMGWCSRGGKMPDSPVTNSVHNQLIFYPALLHLHKGWIGFHEPALTFCGDYCLKFPVSRASLCDGYHCSVQGQGKSWTTWSLVQGQNSRERNGGIS